MIAEAGRTEQSAERPHAMKMDWIPRTSASMPKKRGAAVFAMLVERELMLYAASNSSLPTDSAIIVLVIGTVPFVRKPRNSASTAIASLS